MLLRYLGMSGVRIGGVFEYNVIVRGTNSPRCDDHVVVCAHSPNRLAYLPLIVGDDFNALQLDAQFEAVFGWESANGVIGKGPK
jgi:hypothetical protein